jgi:NADPH2:quinone reductase
MRALRVQRNGPPGEVCEVLDVPVPEPGQVRFVCAGPPAVASTRNGGGFVEKSWRCIAREGRYLCAGFADDPQNGFTPRPLRPTCPGNFSIVGVILAYVENLPSPVRRMGMNTFGRAVGEAAHADLLRLLAEKKIRPLVGRRVALEEAGRALDDHEQRRTTGRTVVMIGA